MLIHSRQHFSVLQYFRCGWYTLPAAQHQHEFVNIFPALFAAVRSKVSKDRAGFSRVFRHILASTSRASNQFCIYRMSTKFRALDARSAKVSHKRVFALLWGKNCSSKWPTCYKNQCLRSRAVSRLVSTPFCVILWGWLIKRKIT